MLFTYGQQIWKKKEQIRAFSKWTVLIFILTLSSCFPIWGSKVNNAEPRIDYSKYVTDNARMFYYSKYPGYFIGFATASSNDKNEAIRMAKIKSLADMSESISLTLVAVVKFVREEKTDGHTSLNKERFQKYILSYSGKSIRNPEYHIIRNWNDRQGITHIKMVAMKKSKVFFEDYMYLPGTLNRGTKNKFANIFEENFIELYTRD